jgi:hypothetical protein
MGNAIQSRWLLAATALSVAAGWTAVGLSAPGDLKATPNSAGCDSCSLSQASTIARLFADPAENELRKFVNTVHGENTFADEERLQFQTVTLAGGHKLAVCFAPGTPLWRISQFMASMAQQSQGAWPYSGGIQPMYYAGGRWPGTAGQRINLSWSFVPDGTSIFGYNGEATAPSTLFATLDAQFSSQGGRATWVSRFEQIFTRWNQLAGINYTRIKFNGNDWDDGASFDSGSGSAGLRGDVRIGMHTIDGGGGILAYNFFPGNGAGGNMVIDGADSWGSTTNQNRFLRNTLGHEHGHGLGLNHVCPTNGSKLMEPFLQTGFDGPRQDEIRGAQALYGDPLEPNDSPAQATDVGNVAAGGSVNNFGALPAPISGTSDVNSSRCSIEGAGKVDWYRFTVSGPSVLSLSVNPVGSTYDDSPQTGGGCTSGTFVNSLAVADLNFDVVSTNGTTVISTAASSGAGATESKSGIVLPTSGTYFIRVYAGNSPTQSQLYSFSLSLSNPAPSLTSISPSQATAGSGAFTLTVNGQNFIPTSVVRWNGADRPTTYVSATQLTAAIPASDIATQGTAAVTVFNPTPGGGTSGSATFTIDAGTVTVVPTAYQASRGVPVAGTLAEVAASDDLFFGWKPGPILSLSESPIDVNLTGASPTATPSVLEFVFEARATTPNIGQRLLLFNWVTNAWEQMDSRTATTSDSTVTISVTSGAARFVDPATLAIRARFQYKANGPVLSFPWNGRIDQAVWRITP